jgi:hypothetical protein
LNLAILVLLVAQPTITSPIERLEGEPIEIESGITVPDEWASFHIWNIKAIESKYPARGRWYDKHNIYSIWAMAGQYEIEHTAVLTDWANKKQDAKTEYRTVIVSPRGPPTPSIPVVVVPPVNPTQPVLVPGKKLVTIVYETTEMSIPMSVHKARIQLEQLGHQVRVLDKDTSPYPPIAGVGLPVIVITDTVDLNKILKSGKLPDTAEAIVAYAN